ncbi:MAG: FAD-dependent oxidoreductase [Chloroflexota bacterium]|nr:FAD-dependent oxidoreductase [Chloroflexota bacterium]
MDFDLVVIGAGAAGSSVAAMAAGRGATVAMAEELKVGGTCLNFGCDPTKTLVRSAEVLHLARTATRFGLEITPSGYPAATADWPAVRRRIAGIIDTIRGGDGDQNVRDSGVALFKSHARFRSPNEIEVDGDVLRASKVVIAAGAATTVPAIAGLREAGYITNVEAVDLPTRPASMVIVGGGVVAIEFAQIFARFGTHVTVMASQDRILPHEEPELTDVLRRVLEDEGIRIETGARVNRVEPGADGKLVTGERNGEPVTCRGEQILLATGRAPAVAGLNLEAAGVAYDRKGVQVDDELRTTAPHIWAVGDVVAGGYPFTHVASYQAKIVDHNAMSGEAPRRVVYDAVPWVTFTDPELARVGMTEAEARQAGHEVETGTMAIADFARAIATDQRDGLIKLVAERGSGKLLGGHILAPHGGEMLGELTLAVRLGLPVSAIAETIHPYPTFSDVVAYAAREIGKD